MTRVLMVSVEPPWPAHHGGRLRVARVAEALSRDFDIVVTYPDPGTDAAQPSDRAQTPVTCRPLPWAPVSPLRSRASILPHIGGHYLLPARRSLRALSLELRPDVVYWSHSYLAAWAPRELRAIPSVVEFANIESNRLRTLVRSAGGARRAARALEATKAAVWEPRVARAASVCVALSEPDQQVLRGWGASAVLAPNGVDLVPYQPSPADGYALAMASYDYEPNIVAARGLIREVWPAVRREVPHARLVVAGRGSEALRDEFEAVDGVTVAGTVDDVSEVYAGAAVALAPATTGGGSQLKLTESLSRGRCVVLSPFAARGLPGPLRDTDGCRAAADSRQFADAIAEALRDVTARHSSERSGWQQAQSLGWSQAVNPVIDAIDRLTTGNKGS